MALNGLKKETSVNNNEEAVNDFISGAKKAVDKLTPHPVSNAKFKRYTFSLTDDVSVEIDNLKLRCRVAKANRSIILKAAVMQLKNLSDEELQKLINQEVESK